MPNDINDFEKKIFGRGGGGGGGGQDKTRNVHVRVLKLQHGKNLFLGSHYKHYNKNCNGHICILYT